MTVDVIIPTLGKPQLDEAVKSLEFLPFPYILHEIRGLKWPEAVNKGIEESENDILLMDDDVVLEPDTFKGIKKYLQVADILGFKLLHPDGKIQHAGGFCIKGQIGHIGYRQEDKGQFDIPYFTCHCTSALLYIKRKVFEKIGGIATDYTGSHFHDVDFSFRALESGFKILYIPNMAWHIESATVGDNPEHAKNMEKNYLELKRRFEKFIPTLEKYPESIRRV